MTAPEEMLDVEPRMDAQAKRRVLKARARELAPAPAEEIKPGAHLEVIAFTLGGERYATEVSCMREVCPAGDLVALPCTPPFVAGILNVRGEVITVIDLKVFFELPAKGLADTTEVLVVQAGTMTFGILADHVSGTRSIPRSEIQPPLAALTGIRAAYLQGITADETIVLDMGRMAADRRLMVDEEVGWDAVGEARSRDDDRPAIDGREKSGQQGGTR